MIKFFKKNTINYNQKTKNHDIKQQQLEQRRV